MVEHWEEEEENTDLISGSVFDYDKKIEGFDLTKFTEDTAVPNGSSIAFLFEYECQGNDIKVLFLADSHPSVIVEALTRLGYNSNNKLELDYDIHTVAQSPRIVLAKTNQGVRLAHVPTRQSLIRLIL